MENTTTAFIGCGNMGRSLIGGLLANAFPVTNLRAADPDHAQRERIQDLFAVDVFADNSAAARSAEVIVLAVKPQVLRATVKPLADLINTQHTLVISIAAGIRLSTLQTWLGPDVAIVRAMPNTPALIQAGATALVANGRASQRQREIAEGLLRSVGSIVWLQREELMDVATALSGSGPAYFFMLMECLEKAAVDLGLSTQQARLLTIETALGAAKMAVESEFDAGELRHQVTSPGGTTERALDVFFTADFPRLVYSAVRAARDRSVDLAKSLGDE